jgi:UDP-N-acetylmuramoyl-L-alanyl-D-glutamate--2,6-diaminopimelate ligase
MKRAQGHQPENNTYLIEVDRSLAIKMAVSIADIDDLILIAGKGHEDYQITGQTKRHFDDREEALKAVDAL